MWLIVSKDPKKRWAEAAEHFAYQQNWYGKWFKDAGMDFLTWLWFLSEANNDFIETSQGKVSMPPLLKAYLRMGARVCGEPAWDPDFNCLDFFVLLRLEDLPARYVQHFLQPAVAVAS